MTVCSVLKFTSHMTIIHKHNYFAFHVHRFTKGCLLNNSHQRIYLWFLFPRTVQWSLSQQSTCSLLHFVPLLRSLLLQMQPRRCLLPLLWNEPVFLPGFGSLWFVYLFIHCICYIIVIMKLSVWKMPTESFVSGTANINYTVQYAIISYVYNSLFLCRI
jgi:hypothetical protein